MLEPAPGQPASAQPAGAGAPAAATPLAALSSPTASPAPPVPPAQAREELSGLLCMALAVTCFSGMAVCVKLLGSEMPAHEKILVRTAVTIPVILWMLRRRGIDPWGNDRRLLLARGLMGFLSMLAYFAALAALPLGNAVLLTHSSPVFAAFFASRYLGERAGRAVWLASAACLLGVACVARPTAHAPLLANVLALAAAALNGGTYTVVRASARRDHHLVVVLALVVVSLPFTAVMSAVHWVTPTAPQWWLLGLMTVLSIAAQIFMTMGMQRETASRATNMFFLGVVLSLIAGQILGDPALQLLDWIGASLILGSIVALAGSGTAAARAARAAKAVTTEGTTAGQRGTPDGAA